MDRFGFVFDMNRCIGCGACQMACKEHHDLEAGEFLRRVEVLPYGENGKGGFYPYSGACNHCEFPACVKVCPVEAKHKAEDGTVLHDDEKCIGCGACLWSCPYGAISFSKSRGVTQKCDGCYDLRRAGKDPVCVAICRTSALQFSQTGEVNQDMVSDIPALACSSLTKPSLKIRLSEMLLGETAKTITEEAIHSREEQTQKETPFIRDTDKTFIILGTGVAGLCAAEAIRERNRTCRIIMIGKEKIPPYSRPMLSKTNIRTYDASYTLLKPESWYQQEGIELLTDTVVLSLNTATKTVHCDKADFSYDKCIYALGAKNFIPPIPGRDKQNVFSVRTIPVF